ncbi:DUF7310 family coiled-coil domain-containing protein [Halorubrum vacuolatum]|uniref:DUF7310 domain-containing protein n=1 Tax=Halorubrum vacuolatum TaxID=63740 RepID=A0A238X3Y6_HALVU|nr:hypothetical protein [Halorubrum vacuolatum]SNR53400.1 hypothetical protein SAMN06264855_11324 [Halorubrum vacuolatum]
MFANGVTRGSGGRSSRRNDRPVRTDGGAATKTDGGSRTTADESTDIGVDPAGNDRIRGDDTEPNGRNDAAGNDEWRLEERLRAVERALTGGGRPVADLEPGAAAADERERLDERLCDLESRVEELEAATQAVRGYVGAVRAVNCEVERRADLALAAATEARAEGARKAEDCAEDEMRSGTDGTAVGADERDPLDAPAVAAALPDARLEAAGHGRAADPENVGGNRDDTSGEDGTINGSAGDDGQPKEERSKDRSASASTALKRLREVL